MHSSMTAHATLNPHISGKCIPKIHICPHCLHSKGHTDNGWYTVLAALPVVAGAIVGQAGKDPIVSTHDLWTTPYWVVRTRI